MRAVASAPRAARVGALGRLGFLCGSCWAWVGHGAQVARALDPDYTAAAAQPAVASQPPPPDPHPSSSIPRTPAWGVSRPSLAAPAQVWTG